MVLAHPVLYVLKILAVGRCRPLANIAIFASVYEYCEGRSIVGDVEQFNEQPRAFALANYSVR